MVTRVAISLRRAYELYHEDDPQETWLREHAGPFQFAHGRDEITTWSLCTFNNTDLNGKNIVYLIADPALALQFKLMWS